MSGDLIRFMWDYGVSVPLWGRLRPHEPDWRQRALGLSEHVIQACATSGQDMNTADGTAWDRRSKDEREHAYRELDAQARDVVEGVRRELARDAKSPTSPW